MLILGVLLYLLPLAPLRNALSRVALTRFMAVMLLPGLLPVPFEAPAKPVLLAGVVGAAILFGFAVALRRPLLGGRSIRFRRRLAQLSHAIRALRRRPGRLVLGWLLGTSVQGS